MSDTALPQGPERDSSWRWLFLVLPVALGLLAVGQWVLWFICDDAYIAFRYVGNSQLGWGYTWNPPPFRPVEGYTSFLWVALLDVVWRVTGYDPPTAVNAVSLVFASGSVLLTAAMAWRSAGRAWWGARAALVALVLWGTLTNRTFLTWTSSGLETPMFVFLVLAWVWLGLFAARGQVWGFVVMLVAAAIALTRPDGLLYVACSVLMVGAEAWRRGARLTDAVALLPVGIVIAHLLWRHETYGAWLPNTYYAKSLGAWPRAGFAYLALFLLQYMWWLWLPVAWLAWRRRGVGWFDFRGQAATWIVYGTLVFEVLYYTVMAGGDHFEFRIFAHLPPLLFVALAWMLDKIELRRAGQVVVFLWFTTSTWIVAWTDWYSLLGVTKWDDIFQLDSRIEKKLWPIYPYVWVHEELQGWLVDQSICGQWQTHKWFALGMLKRMPERDESLTFADAADWTRDATGEDAFPVALVSSVGVVGWTLPYVAVIDRLGLNDYVAARNPLAPGQKWRIAHSRRPPPGYSDCFKPNVAETSGPKRKDRKAPLTWDDIVSCEDKWWGKADRHELVPGDPKKY